MVKPKVLAPMVEDFFTSDDGTLASAIADTY